jgi:hypothetical protein
MRYFYSMFRATIKMQLSGICEGLDVLARANIAY